MLDKSIDSALLALRKQIIRSGSDGLAHVEALLALRGVDLPRVSPARVHGTTKRNETALLVIGALRDGPMARSEVVAVLAAAKPLLDAKRCYHRVDHAMAKLRAKGVVCVVRRGVWCMLTLPAASSK
ncbi:MAG TPA: hypothetical protein PKD10_17000 [Paracoccaceae bacterium]|nr:hypothetical protein [Paracoccaceae bacterium]